MFDEPMKRGSRLPESPRINSLLAGLMGSHSAPAPTPPAPPTPAPAAPVLPISFEAAPAPKSITARPFGTFLKSIQWAYVPSSSSLVVITPGIPVREFFGLINWSGDRDASPTSFGGSAVPMSVENLMSQFSWD